MHDNWIACIVLLLSFSPTLSCFHSKDGEKNSLYIKDKILIIQTVLSNVDNASINCPGMEVNKENVHITLHKETELHFTHFQNNQVTNTSEETQRYRVDVKKDTVDYVIDMPQVNDTGLYNCTIAHGHVTQTTQTFLLVKDPESRCDLPEGRSASWLLLAAGCGFLAVYNLIITIVTCFFVWKLQHQDTYQHDYFNTRPGEFSRGK